MMWARIKDMKIKQFGPASNQVVPLALMYLSPLVGIAGCAAQEAAPAAQVAKSQVVAPAAVVGTARPLRKEAGHKKLLNYVSREAPDTAFMRKHIAQMEKSPFDGVFLTIKVTKPDGTQGNFMSENWGSHAFTEADFKPALDDIKATKFGRFTDNYPLFLTVSQNRDWFDDFSAIMNNARLTASFARQANEATGGKVPGILFDGEQYADKLFTYSAQRDKNTKSWWSAPHNLIHPEPWF